MGWEVEFDCQLGCRDRTGSCSLSGSHPHETDFAHHITDLIAQDPKAGLILIVDQLNTHQSESLVRLVATQCQLCEDLGIKGKLGILESMASCLLSQ